MIYLLRSNPVPVEEIAKVIIDLCLYYTILQDDEHIMEIGLANDEDVVENYYVLSNA